MIRCVLLLMLLGGWWCSILAAEDPLIGTWRSASGDFFQFRPDGTAIVKGALVRWRVMNGQLVLSSSDGQVNLPYTLSGNQIVVQSEEGIGAYSRYENAAPVALAFDSATAPVGTIPRAETLSVEVITGVWLGPEGTSVLRPGGVGKAQGITFTWSIEGQSLLLRHADKQAQMPARLEGGKLILGTGPEIAYTRAIGAAGWWCAWDGPVDSRQSKGEFHHFALLPNGTASFAKGDLGAMRTGEIGRAHV